MKKLAVGILAHVDAGKTTLSEAMLYLGGSIRTMGRVDKKDTFLDSYELEKARGITIFSKQAQLVWRDTNITLLDTPGHVDFSAEMERTLQVLDYAILVISGSDGVQGHSKTLWRLLKSYQIPTFIWVNKMDQGQNSKADLMRVLKEQLSDACIDFGGENRSEWLEQIAMLKEDLLEFYLEQGTLEPDHITAMIQKRLLFPCLFGSALKMQGVEQLLDLICLYACEPERQKAFAARVYKITRDEAGTRLTFVKVSGGSLEVKDVVSCKEQSWQQKVNQIRIYSGLKYETVSRVEAGTVCALTGLDNTYPGLGLGDDGDCTCPVLSPVLTYGICLPEGCEPAVMLPKLRLLEEEDPMLHLVWQEQSQEILVQVMGQVQLEVLQTLIRQRFGVEVEFSAGSIVYKETIQNKVEGVGHFEPLRHYAEVHLILEPGAAGSGLVFESQCPEDVLERSWQRLILTHLAEKEHRGVLCGMPITDMKITLVSGKAHPKHTEGGDFRQATYRAVRQGLMQAQSVLLEPYYQFVLEVPEQAVGRAMTDLEMRQAVFDAPDVREGVALLQGLVPVAALADYHREVIAYTKGSGRLFCSYQGYGPCHNSSQIIEQIGYDADRDTNHPSGSVFCSHGAGFVVDWHQVPAYMHLESCLPEETVLQPQEQAISGGSELPLWIDDEEVERILNRASFANQGKDKKVWKKATVKSTSSQTAVGTYRKPVPRQAYLLVDGYNMIFAWPQLKELAQVTMDGAKAQLLDILCNYQAMKGMKLIVVFDAYRVQGHKEETLQYHNIYLVYTKEAETADQYIEKFAHNHKATYDITVATSDAMEQIIIMGQGCHLLSARELKQEVDLVMSQMQEEYLEKQQRTRQVLGETIKGLDPAE